MSLLKLIHHPASSFSERVRWALEHKAVPYQAEEYAVATGEDELARLTGQRQVPVLMVDGRPLPDSTAILEWLEERVPEPALLPRDEGARAQVMLYEEVACAVLGPQARLLFIGRMLGAENERIGQVGRFFAGKYHHSAYAEQAARAHVRRALTIFTQSLNGRRYLVGDTFTRADLTVATMLMVANPPPEAALALKPSWMRSMLQDPMATEASFAPLFAWRDRIYADHRGSAVKS
jgi:glutathione S-transferase